MNKLEKWPGLRLPVVGRDDPAEDERLLKLFWNRAELKKGLQELDDQLHNLRDRLKQQEGANARLEEQLDQLEVLLGSPSKGHEALVHFGLKGLWRECRSQLEQFAGDLRRQRQDHERKRLLAEFQNDRAERIKVADARLAAAESDHEGRRERLAAIDARHARLTGFWNYFRRREIAVEAEALRGAVAEAARVVEDMREARRTLEKEPTPEFPGLSVDGRRAVNLAVIAYAQLLCTRLAASGLAAEARLAAHRRVQDARHGSRAECLTRLDEIARGLAVVKAAENLAPEVRTRTEKLRAAVSFRTPDETVPAPASLPPTTAGGGNVLIDDYWDINRVLLG